VGRSRSSALELKRRGERKERKPNPRCGACDSIGKNIGKRTVLYKSKKGTQESFLAAPGRLGVTACGESYGRPLARLYITARGVLRGKLDGEGDFEFVFGSYAGFSGGFDAEVGLLDAGFAGVVAILESDVDSDWASLPA